jgi:hypothetical protein
MLTITMPDHNPGINNPVAGPPVRLVGAHGSRPRGENSD